MFLRNEKKSPGWAFIGIGLILCAISLFLLSGALGYIPTAGRAGGLVLIGVPFGMAAIIIGIVALYRGARER